jgi:hypothetical protein
VNAVHMGNTVRERGLCRLSRAEDAHGQHSEGGGLVQTGNGCSAHRQLNRAGTCRLAMNAVHTGNIMREGGLCVDWQGMWCCWRMAQG